MISHSTSTSAISVNLATGVNTGIAAGDIFTAVEIVQGTLASVQWQALEEHSAST
jgi:hypothetical protein